jgi:hypothetical protein
MRRVAPAIALTGSERRELQRIARAGTSERRMVDRAQFVLRAAAGKSNQEIAVAINVRATTVPVYPRRADYEAADSEMAMGREAVFLEHMLSGLKPPSEETSFADIADLRDSKDFAKALFALRIWQTEKLPNVLASPDQRSIELALGELDFMIERYRKAVESRRWAKLGSIVTFLFAIPAAFVASAKLLEAAKDLRNVTRPTWAAVQDELIVRTPAAAIVAADTLF